MLTALILAVVDDSVFWTYVFLRALENAREEEEGCLGDRKRCSRWYWDDGDGGDDDVKNEVVYADATSAHAAGRNTNDCSTRITAVVDGISPCISQAASSPCQCVENSSTTGRHSVSWFMVNLFGFRIGVGVLDVLAGTSAN